MRLGGLSALTVLDLGGNALIGAIPGELGSLSGLAYLDLGGNRLSDSIPAALGSLSNLTVLDLGDNLVEWGRFLRRWAGCRTCG